MGTVISSKAHLLSDASSLEQGLRAVETAGTGVFYGHDCGAYIP